MIEKDGCFVCTACGSNYDLQYIADSFATLLMCEAIEIYLGLKKWQENEENIFSEQFEEDSTEDEDIQDNADAEEVFFAAEDISGKAKTEYCLRNYLYYRIGEENVIKANFYLKRSILFDKENFMPYLFNALEVEVSSYILTRNNDRTAWCKILCKRKSTKSRMEQRKQSRMLSGSPCPPVVPEDGTVCAALAA